MSRNHWIRVAALGVWIGSGSMYVSSTQALEVEEVTLEATHMIFTNFREVHTVKLGEKFLLSDTDYSAVAAEFVPDFVIDSETKVVTSRSENPNNPAVRVVVYQGEAEVDELWAFPGKGAPHFYRESFLAFTLVDYKIKAQTPPVEKEDEKADDRPAEEGIPPAFQEGQGHESP